MPFRNPTVVGDRPTTGRRVFTDATGATVATLSGDGLEIFDPATGDLIAALGPEAAAQGGDTSSLVLLSPTGETDYQGGQVAAAQVSGTPYVVLSSPQDSVAVTGAALYLVAGATALMQLGQLGTAGLAVDLTEAGYVAVDQVVHAVTGSVPGTAPIRETWHVVGAAGEPAFGANWGPIGGTDLDPMFRRGVAGEVQLAGRAASVGAVTSTSRTLWTMPAAYRPATRVILATAINAPSVAAVLEIGTDGTVQVLNLNGTPTVNSLELSGLSYPLAT